MGDLRGSAPALPRLALLEKACTAPPAPTTTGAAPGAPGAPETAERAAVSSSRQAFSLLRPGSQRNGPHGRASRAAQLERQADKGKLVALLARKFLQEEILQD